MHDLIGVFGPILGLLLTQIWIPLNPGSVGAIRELLLQAQE